MRETTAGLPNTCSRCGRDPGPSWYAASEDAALAGQGVCADCHAPSPSAAPDPEPPSVPRRRR